MNPKFYKYCTVPLCKNTTIKTPQKLFIHVPTEKEMRKQWSRAARREQPPIAKSAYFCEDHFNMPKDMENYMEYKIMGMVKTVRMRKDCVPTRFDCQKKKNKPARKDCQWVKKRKADEITKQRKDLIEIIMNENEAEVESTAKKKSSKKHCNTLDTLPVSRPKSTKTEECLKKELQNKALKMPLTPAEKQKRYREKMKLENPDKYEECRKKVAENNKFYYRETVSQYTEEEKEKLRQQWKDSKGKTSSAKKQTPLTPAERQKKYREKLKTENPDKYEEYKKRRAEHSKLYYREKSKQYTEEEKEKMRQHWRDSKRKTTPVGKQRPLTPAERQKRYREKMKKDNPDKYEECKKRVAENNKLYYREKVRQYTEEEKEKMRQRWRDSKRKTSSAKKRRPLTPAERQKKYREKLKMENPDKYLEIKKDAAEYSRRYYREKLSSNVEEQWNDVRRIRLSPAERMKRYRERLKRDNPAKYVELLKRSAEKAKLYYRKKAEQYTEEEKEARRQTWRKARRINKRKRNKRKVNKKNTRKNSEESWSEQDAEPGTSEIPITPPWHVPDSPGVSDSSALDPLRRHTDRCRFCGELSNDCFIVSSHMPYLAGHRTTFALNDTTIQLDFNDGLPKTVCRYCDTKLQEICDFIKTVKDAQDSLLGKIKAEKNVEIDVVIKTETDSTDGDSISISDTVFVKTLSSKRKSGVIKKAKTKVSKPNVMVECENEFVIDIKQEVIDEDMESSRHSDADSETLSIPDELKRANAFCDTGEETIVGDVVEKDKVGSDTTINAVCALSPETLKKKFEKKSD